MNVTQNDHQDIPYGSHITAPSVVVIIIYVLPYYVLTLSHAIACLYIFRTEQETCRLSVIKG